MRRVRDTVRSKTFWLTSRRVGGVSASYLSAQQSAGDVERAITTNAALKIVGRLDAATAEEYRFLSAELRGRATRFLPGTMVLDQPLVPAPIPFRFPMPPFATNTGDDAQAKALAGDEGAIAEAFRRL